MQLEQTEFNKNRIEKKNSIEIERITPTQQVTALGITFVKKK